MANSRSRKKAGPMAPLMKTLNIDEIKPYWRNPRRVPEEAVAAVAVSIRDYGYNQPVVVDDENVIIIGHTRYAAMRRLGVTQVPVLVAKISRTAANELRVIDNRVAEFTSWDFSALTDELRELDKGMLASFFPEVDPDGMTMEPRVLPEVPPERVWDDVVPEVEFVCPGCFHTFEVVVTPQAVRTGTLKASTRAAKESA